MRAGFSALALLIAATVAASAATDAEIGQKIVGSWGDDAACVKGMLVFNADGTFLSKDKEDNADFNGTYSIADGRLNGKVGDNAMPEMVVSFEEEMLVLAAGGSGRSDRLTRCTAP
jgi:hypothetical protein